MEQNNIIEQNVFPIKIKIAIRLQDIISILLLLPVGVFFFIYFNGFGLFSSGNLGFLIPGIVVFLIFLTFIFSGLLMLKRKKIGWWIAIIINALMLIMWFLLSLSYLRSMIIILVGGFLIIINLTILILLLLERKNFFRIAS